jgi:hypothetical protein
MDKAEFARLMAPLTAVYPQDVDKTTWAAYYPVLKDIPTAMLALAVERAIAMRNWFPRPAELRQDAEACRREIVAANPYTGCVECEHHKGWRELIADGVVRYERCGCHRRYRQRMEQLGLSARQPASPPAESHELTRIGEIG